MTKEQKKAIADRLAELEDAAGRLTPDIVIADARKASSPLHSCFEWNDGKAARAWRIEQARELIRSVMVIVTTDNRAIEIVRYVRDPDQESDEQGYVSTAKLITDKDRARVALVEEFARAAAALRRARDLAQAFGLAGEVEKIEARIERVSKRVEALA